MSSRGVLALAAAAAISIGSLAGCGKGDNAPPGRGASQLTVYSSLPLQGPFREQAQSIINAEKLALSQAGGQVGPFTVKYVSLDDSRGDTGRWDPGTVMSNARQAVEDRTTIAYIGEADSGASAVAIPVLNEAGILTVSPSSTYAGLTSSADADKGEPEKYYPSGVRTFARLVPADSHQARVQVRLQAQAGCRTLYLISDRDVYGRGIAGAVGREARARGMTIVGQTALLRNQTDFGGLVNDVVKHAPDCVFTGLTLNDQAPALYAAVHRARPGAELFAPDALAVPTFAAALDAGAAARTTFTSVAPADLSRSARGRAFTKAYTARYGSAPGPWAAYGYAAMKAVLAAIADAGNKANRRPVVVQSFLGLTVRDSVLGAFSFDRAGDTSRVRYAVQHVRGGRLRTVAVDGSGA